MNRKPLTAIALLALASVSGCTRQQIAAAIALHESSSTAPSVSAAADCQNFTFTVSGYPDGTNVFVEIGSEPPRGFTVGGDPGGFTPIAGGATGTIAIPSFWTTQVFGATIDMTVNGENVRAFDQEVDCSS